VGAAKLQEGRYRVVLERRVMTLHAKNFELQDVVELKFEGKTEYGVIVEVLAPGCRPKCSGFTALPGKRYPGASAVVRVDLKTGETTCDWLEMKDLTQVYMEHRRPVC
jgi:hypothetical protein